MTASAADAEFDLGAYLHVERRRVEQALGEVRARASHLPSPIGEPLDYALRAGGKRLRPILLVAAYRAAGGEPDGDAIYRLACAVELIHTYSLVHDDLPVMDDDELRRGRPTTHRVYGDDAAAIAGFLMIPLAAEVVEGAAAQLSLPAARTRAMVIELCSGAGGMVGGQWLDLAAEGGELGVAELEAVHAAKTGALIATSVRLGAMAAGGDDGVIGALGEYGAALGLAFQIADDILDVTGDVDATGKTVGRDAELGKATYPGLLGLEGARDRALGASHAAVRVLAEHRLESEALAGLARWAVERTG